MKDKFKESFKEETLELLSELEFALMHLEKDKNSIELIDTIFRIIHTIKGTSAMFGFGQISGFAHQAENLFDLLRSRKLEVTSDLIDLSFKIKDCIANMIKQTFDENPVDEQIINNILSSIYVYIPGLENKNNEEFPYGKILNKELESEKLNQITTYRIRFQPPQDIFLRGLNPCVLLAHLINMGKYKAVAYINAIPEITEINPELCYCSWDIILTTDKGINAIKDVFIFIENDSKLEIDIIDEIDTSNLDTEYKKLGEILLEKGDISSSDLNLALSSKKLIGEILVEKNITSKSIIEAALVEQECVRESRKKQQIDTAITSIKVKSDRLDKLFNMVGELVTAKARLVQTASIKNDPDLLYISEEMERITEALYANIMNIRMLPIGTIFEKFNRLVRDISRELGKEVELYIEGSATELDKNVIEKLNDPLMHLIRNSVDHGIETPGVREQKGKDKKGVIRLKAAHSGTNIIIEINDDGAGIDQDKVTQIAIWKKMIPGDKKLMENEIYDLIFKPGFSTTSHITQISGRGVGMDVVKKAIDSLGGSIAVQSKKDQGTTIVLKIPLTLSIIEGLLVSIENQYFVIPLQFVQECIELAANQQERQNQELINLRGKALPYIRLKEFFRIPGNRPDVEMIIIVKTYNALTGLVVEQVVGEYQIVIKSLGRMYQSIQGILGASILGDGTIALILDVNNITEQALAGKCEKLTYTNI